MGIESPRSHGDPSVNVQLQGTGAPVNQTLQEVETGRSLRRGCQPVTAFRVYPEVQKIRALYRLELFLPRNTGLCYSKHPALCLVLGEELGLTQVISSQSSVKAHAK